MTAAFGGQERKKICDFEDNSLIRQCEGDTCNKELNICSCAFSEQNDPKLEARRVAPLPKPLGPASSPTDDASGANEVPVKMYMCPSYEPFTVDNDDDAVLKQPVKNKRNLFHTLLSFGDFLPVTIFVQNGNQDNEFQTHAEDEKKGSSKQRRVKRTTVKKHREKRNYKPLRRCLSNKMSGMWCCLQKRLRSQRFSSHNRKKSNQRGRRRKPSVKWLDHILQLTGNTSKLPGLFPQNDPKATISALMPHENRESQAGVTTDVADGRSRAKVAPSLVVQGPPRLNINRMNIDESSAGRQKDLITTIDPEISIADDATLPVENANKAVTTPNWRIQKNNNSIFIMPLSFLRLLTIVSLCIITKREDVLNRLKKPKKHARRILKRYYYKLCRKKRRWGKAVQKLMRIWQKYLDKEKKKILKSTSSLWSAISKKKRILTQMYICKKGGARSKFYIMTRRNKKVVARIIHRKRDQPPGEIVRCLEDNKVLASKTYIVEEPELKLTQPPIRSFQSLQRREESFSRITQLPIPAPTLARSGFFLNDQDRLQCYSCQFTYNLNDVVQAPLGDIRHAPGCQRNERPGVEHSHPSPHQVLADGQVSDIIRDPPGQQSIYIPPGDVRSESYRLSTFEHFPVACPISRKSLAKSGFYFTGFFDRVKCFACGRTTERWEANDNPADLRWHKDTCQFPRGGDCGNVPITSLFNRIHGNLPLRSVSQNPNEEVLEERDPDTGLVVRTVRFPRDLPERIRQSGGIFEIGPNNHIRIQSGPGLPGGRIPGALEAPQIPSPNVRSQHQPQRQWRMANVISADHRRFLTNLYLNRQLDRLASFARWPTGRPNVSPSALAKSGFLYLGDMDRTQCFSCGGVLRNWTVDDDAEAEHRMHFPNCRFVLGTEPRNVPVPQLPDTPDERQRNFPCRFPSNPHMRSETARLETFDRRWPMGRTAATPAEIAQAGFFFLGERDRVKCWYCNGGLQHWEYDDVPWVEHAKWFPNCQFLLSVKGQHFVYRHLSDNAHLARPIIARQDGSPIDPPSNNEIRERPPDIPPSERVRQPSPPPTIIDPQEEMRKKRERVENVMKNSDIVRNVLAMGFSENIVKMLLQEKVEAGTEENPDDIYGTVSGLLDDVMKKEEEVRKEEEERRNQASAGPSTSAQPSMSSVFSSMSAEVPTSSLGPSPGTGKYNVSYFGDDDDELMDQDMYGTEPPSGNPSLNSVTLAKQHEGGEGQTASLQEALNLIEEERMCKICYSNQADMVFVPCGHMCCCMQCTQAIRQCPVCRVKIEKAIKTYLS